MVAEGEPGVVVPGGATDDGLHVRGARPRAHPHLGIEAVAVGPFLANIGELVAPQATAKSLEMHYVPGDKALAVRADPEKLRQILLNLLSNAIRFTPSGGTISLEASADDASRVEVESWKPDA